MEKSAFIKWINTHFAAVVLYVVNKLNGKDQALTYMFKQMLKPKFSATGKWEAIHSLRTRVSADYVAMDSPLPLKKRHSLRKASGDIVKSGMELWLNETQLTELDTMAAVNAPQKEIVRMIFDDTEQVITGVYELIEKSFLEGLSTGVTVLDDTENVGLGVRMDFGYLTENKFGVTELWSNPTTSRPLDDIRAAIKKAKTAGNVLRHIWMDDVTFQNFVNSDQVKQYFAWTLQFAGNNALIPVPSLEQINTALRNDRGNYGLTINIVDRQVVNEKDGVQTVVTPWAEGNVIFTTTTDVGVYVYARLAEQNHPVAGVEYQTADNYILVSKFRQNSPSLRETTRSQARVVPVIYDADKIYLLETKTIQA